MIKSVLACLPVYFMSLFQIPTSIKVKLEKIQRRFLWGGLGTTRKIHWVDWNSVCNHKDNGGLEIMDVSIKNRALLYKWFWRYGEEPSALWRKIIDSKYGGDTLTSFLLSVSRGSSPECGVIFLRFNATLTSIQAANRLLLAFLWVMAVAFGFGMMNGLRG